MWIDLDAPPPVLALGIRALIGRVDHLDFFRWRQRNGRAAHQATHSLRAAGGTIVRPDSISEEVSASGLAVFVTATIASFWNAHMVHYLPI